jgi:hypothetical protein
MVRALLKRGVKHLDHIGSSETPASTTGVAGATALGVLGHFKQHTRLANP